MKFHRSIPPVVLLFAIIGLSPSGCNRQGGPPAATPTRVLVSFPIEKEVTDYSDFTGLTSAVDSVDIRARVFGYLDKVNFKEGALVKKGDVLFEIDPRTYQALVNQAKAKVETDEAQARYNLADYNRYLALSKTNAVSKDDVDKALANRDVANSTVIADKADLASKELDLYFTKVTAPVDGRVGRIIVTVGNLIQSGGSGGTGTLLTTLVSVDPVYCLFDVDEHNFLRVSELIRQGKVKSARDYPRPIMLALANEKNFPHPGTINFVDNQINAKTGTIRLRGIFPNPDKSLVPGLFARVRMPLGDPHKAILISDRAIDTDQGQKIVYLIDENNKVSTRAVNIGPMQDGMRVIEDGGVKPTERIIVEGFQQVRVDAIVDPKEIPMPAAGSTSAAPDAAKSENPK